MRLQYKIILGAKQSAHPSLSMCQVHQGLTPLIDMLGQEIRSRFPQGNAVISIDGHSGSGKSYISELLQAHLDNAPILNSDVRLKPRQYRHAIQKWLTGEPITKQEINMIPADLLFKTPGRSTYYDELSFFEHTALLNYIVQADSFYKSNRSSAQIVIQTPYSQQTKQVLKTSLIIILRRNSFLIQEGKYSNLSVYWPYLNLKIRIHDNISRIRSRFAARTNRLSPEDANRQLIFFDKALLPSFQAYAITTEHALDYIVDISAADPAEWNLVHQTTTNPQPI